MKSDVVMKWNCGGSLEWWNKMFIQGRGKMDAERRCSPQYEVPRRCRPSSYTGCRSTPYPSKGPAKAKVVSFGSTNRNSVNSKAKVHGNQCPKSPFLPGITRHLGRSLLCLAAAVLNYSASLFRISHFLCFPISRHSIPS